mmetsp:Transcript_58031/g.66867  ORF Transcript_58031/g.66867 Transcript_58031/m.66867 type:complete len:223 (+) Transcript_58031:39-707(+)
MRKFVDKTVSMKRLSQQFARFGGGGGGAAYETFKSIQLNEQNFKHSLAHRIHYFDEVNQYQLTSRSTHAEANTIYKSEHVASTRNGLRDFTLLHFAAFYPLAAGTGSFLFGAPFVGYSIYRLYENFVKETKRNLVSELEYVHGDKSRLKFKLLSENGGFRNVEEDVSNLEIVDASHIDQKNIADPFWPTRTELDTRVIFRNKTTKEHYCFDKHGDWTLDALF